MWKIKSFQSFILVGCFLFLQIDCSEISEPDDKPRVEILRPENGDRVKGQVEIEAKAEDNKGITQVEIYLDNRLPEGGSLLIPPYLYLWDTSDLEDMSWHTIFAKAYDTDDNMTGSKLIMVRVDRSEGPPDPVSLLAAPKGITSDAPLVAIIDKSDSTTVIDRDLASGVTYFYRLFVHDTEGNIIGSNEQSAVPMEIPAGNYALFFDGVDDYLVSIDDVMPDYNAITMECWFSTTTNNQWTVLLAKGRWNVCFINRFTSDGDVLAIFDGMSVDESRSYGSGYNEGEWHHYAATNDGDTTRIYIDGEFLGSKNEPLVANTDSLVAGLCDWLHLGYDVHYSGYLDEIRIWDRALSQGEIQANMSRSLSGNEPSLKLYWRFDEGQGDASFDSTPFGHLGRLGRRVGPDLSDPLWVGSEAPIW
jgi:hypothetical protein